MRRIILYLLIGLIILSSALMIWQVPKWQVDAYKVRFDSSTLAALSPKERIEFETNLITAENSARATVAQSIGGLLLIFSLGATWYNIKATQKNSQESIRVAEEGKITDRFSKAIELLGNSQMEVRLGGIYALERIAKDSQKDHWTIMEVLSSFVREKAKTGAEDTNTQTDIQAILTVIGRRKWIEIEGARKVNLAYTSLVRANLSEAYLPGANLRGVNLSGANLSGATLSGANLSGATLSGANLNGTNLNGTNLSSTNLSEANLSKAHLRGADLREANLSDVNLSEADLRGAFLSEADLSSAHLRKANVSEADLNGAKLNGADLREANLSSANLCGVKLSEAFLSNANLSKANLRGANLSEANLSDANLSEADLRGAVLREADLSSANLREARLRGADLSGADLTDAKNLPQTIADTMPSAVETEQPE